MKNKGKYQKALLIVMVAMLLVFAVIYSKTLSRVGYRYRDAILVPTQENGSTVFSGKINRKLAQFTIFDDQSVMFQYGDKNYGTYTMKEDPTAVPKERTEDQLTGIEIRNGDELVFRGGVWDAGDFYWLYHEDGETASLRFSFVAGDGIERDENGNVIDPMEPSAATLYELLTEPELTHKGEALAWFAAAFICILNGLSILFADELFRLNLSFRIRNVESAEPSDWEIASRYIGWTVLTIMAFAVLLMGLQ